MRLGAIIYDLATRGDAAFAEQFQRCVVETFPEHANTVVCRMPADGWTPKGLAAACVDEFAALEWPQERINEQLFLVVVVCIDPLRCDPVAAMELGNALRDQLRANFRSPIVPRLFTVLSLPVTSPRDAQWDVKGWKNALDTTAQGDTYQRLCLLQPTNAHGNGQGNPALSTALIHEQLIEILLTFLCDTVLELHAEKFDSPIFSAGAYTLSYHAKPIMEGLAFTHAHNLVDLYSKRVDEKDHIGWPGFTALTPRKVFAEAIRHPECGTVFGAIRFLPEQLRVLFLSQLTGRISSYNSFLALKIVPAEVERFRNNLAEIRANLQQQINKQFDILLTDRDTGSVVAAQNFLATTVGTLRQHLVQIRTSNAINNLRRELATDMKIPMDAEETALGSDYAGAMANLLDAIKNRVWQWAVMARFLFLGIVLGFGLQLTMQMVTKNPTFASIASWSHYPVWFLLGFLITGTFGYFIWYRDWTRIKQRLDIYQATVINYHRLQLADQMTQPLENFYVDLLYYFDHTTAKEEDASHQGSSAADVTGQLAAFNDVLKTWAAKEYQDKSNTGHSFRTPISDGIDVSGFPYQLEKGNSLSDELSLKNYLEIDPFAAWREASQTTWQTAGYEGLLQHAESGFAYLHQQSLAGFCTKVPDLAQILNRKWETFYHLSYPYQQSPVGQLGPRVLLLLPDVDTAAVAHACGLDDANSIMAHHKATSLACDGKTDVTLLQLAEGVKYRELALFAGIAPDEESAPVAVSTQQNDNPKMMI